MTCGCESADGKCTKVSVCYMEAEIADVAEDRDALRRELAEAQRDAARYRWLRERRGSQVVIDSAGYEGQPDEVWPSRKGIDLDAAIDAAMAEPKEPAEDWLCSQPDCGKLHSEHVKEREPILKWQDMDGRAPWERKP